jgi:hypothetical protein
MENKDKYRLFESVYLTLLKSVLDLKTKNDFALEEIDMEQLHKKVFSRAFMLTAFVVNDVKEAKIIS